MVRPQQVPREALVLCLVSETTTFSKETGLDPAGTMAQIKKEMTAGGQIPTDEYACYVQLVLEACESLIDHNLYEPYDRSTTNDERVLVRTFLIELDQSHQRILQTAVYVEGDRKYQTMDHMVALHLAVVGMVEKATEDRRSALVVAAGKSTASAVSHSGLATSRSAHTPELAALLDEAMPECNGSSLSASSAVEPACAESNLVAAGNLIPRAVFNNGLAYAGPPAKAGNDSTEAKAHAPNSKTAGFYFNEPELALYKKVLNSADLGKTGMELLQGMDAASFKTKIDAILALGVEHLNETILRDSVYTATATFDRVASDYTAFVKSVKRRVLDVVVNKTFGFTQDMGDKKNSAHVCGAICLSIAVQDESFAQTARGASNPLKKRDHEVRT